MTIEETRDLERGSKLIGGISQRTWNIVKIRRSKSNPDRITLHLEAAGNRQLRITEQNLYAFERLDE